MADDTNKSGKKKRSTGSRTLARGLALLSALGDATEGETVSGLAEATDLDRAVLYRLLDTLTEEGFVTRDPETRKYRLGLAMLELGVRAATGLEVRRLAGPALKALSEETDETACLAVRDRDDLVVVEVIEPGDRFVPIGKSGSAKLQDLFVNQKIAREERHLRVLGEAIDGRIFWVQGLRIAEPFKVTEATGELLVFRFS